MRNIYTFIMYKEDNYFENFNTFHT